MSTRSVRGISLRAWALIIAVVAFSAGGFGRFGSDAYERLFGEPSVSAQLERIRRDAAQEEERFTAVSSRAQLHGTGQPSWVVVVRDRFAVDFQTAETRPPTGIEPSDELRIYDLHDGRLEEAFAFRPKWRPAAFNPFARIYLFRVHTIADFDGDGDDEILGSWSETDTERPVVISWSDLDGDYRLYPLFAPEFSSRDYLGVPVPQIARARDDQARSQRRRYLNTVPLVDVETGSRFRSYAVGDFFVTHRNSELVVVGAYVVDYEPFTAELQAWAVAFDGLSPTAFGCEKASPVLFRVREGRISEAIRSVWSREQARFRC